MRDDQRAIGQLQLAPMHRNDPSESVEAARKVNASHQLELVVLSLYRVGQPLTDDAIAEACGLLRHSAGTRRGVARGMGLVEKAGRGVSALGNAAATWRLTPAGVQHAEQIIQWRQRNEVA